MHTNRSGIITFCSPYHGQTCNTSNMAAIGTYIGTNYNLKTLLMHSKLEKSNLENAFLRVERNNSDIFMIDSGIDSLVNLAITKQLEPGVFEDYTKVLIDDSVNKIKRLQLLIGTTKKEKNDLKKLHDSLKYILNCAKESYNLVFCDVNSGFENLNTMTALNESDVIVINLNQNMEILESYFFREVWDNVLHEKQDKIILVLGNYDANSKYTAKYIKNLFDYQNEIFYVPHNINFMDAYNDHNLINWFLTNSEISNKDNNYDFMYNLYLIAEKIMELLKIESKHVNKPIKNTSLFKSLSEIFKG